MRRRGGILETTSLIIWFLILYHWFPCGPLDVKAAPPGGQAAQNQRPNVLFLLTDDQRPDTIHALGNPLIHTPNLDRLAQEGMSFTQAFMYYPLCVPSRAAILAGSFGFRTGVVAPYGNQFNPAIPLWPEVMRKAGYHTWYVGKWMSPGRPTTRGYEESLGLFAAGGAKVKIPVSYDHRGQEVTGYRGWVFQTDQGEVFPEKGVGLTSDIDSKFADAAIEFIRRQPDRPFFLHVNFTAPHDPLLRPPRHVERYDPERFPIPVNFRSIHPFDHGAFWGRDEKMLPWPRTPEDVRRDLAVYYALISYMDEQVGRILAALEETGQLENTLIVFATDNGLAIGSHGLRGKQNMYEHTVMTPLIFRGPGIGRNQKTAAMVYLHELYPTLCDLLGIAIPSQVEGRSFARVIKAETSEFHSEVFSMYDDSQRMVRTARWKLIHYLRLGTYQLFNLEQDPWELANLADDPRHAGTLKDLQQRLRAWQKEQGDPALRGTHP